MGLTIHYSLSTEERDAKKVRRLLTALRKEALRLPFAEVSEVASFSGPKVRSPACSPDWRWFLIQSCRFLGDPVHSNVSHSIAPVKVYGFRTWPGKGCEEANFGLALYPDAVVRADGTSFPTCLDGWSWRSFCKTQYANAPRAGGVINFLRCHLGVVALLDAAARLGFEVEVHDEGGYWEKRDAEALVKAVGEWSKFIAACVGAVKDVAGERGVAVSAPILDRPDFEHLEAAGIRDQAVSRVVELIRSTACK